MLFETIVLVPFYIAYFVVGNISFSEFLDRAAESETTELSQCVSVVIVRQTPFSTECPSGERSARPPPQPPPHWTANERLRLYVEPARTCSRRFSVLSSQKNFENWQARSRKGYLLPTISLKSQLQFTSVIPANNCFFVAVPKKAHTRVILTFSAWLVFFYFFWKIGDPFPILSPKHGKHCHSVVTSTDYA